MNTKLLLVVSLFLSTYVFADDNAPAKIKIEGEAANKIASLSFLETGTTGTSVFATGTVKVTCFLSTPLVAGGDVIAEPSHYTCILSQGSK